MTAEQASSADAQAREDAIHRDVTFIDAAAGSGKTATIVLRVIRHAVLDAEPIPIDRIALATFTIAAAGELRARARTALEDLRQWAATAAGAWKAPSSEAERTVAMLIGAQDVDDESRARIVRRCDESLAALDRVPWGTLHSLCLTLIQRTIWAHAVPASVDIRTSADRQQGQQANADATTTYLQAADSFAWAEPLLGEPINIWDALGDDLNSDTAASFTWTALNGAVGQRVLDGRIESGLDALAVAQTPDPWTLAAEEARQALLTADLFKKQPAVDDVATDLAERATRPDAPELTSADAIGFMAHVIAAEESLEVRQKVRRYLASKSRAWLVATLTGTKQSWRDDYEVTPKVLQGLSSTGNAIAQRLRPPKWQHLVTIGLVDDALTRARTSFEERTTRGKVDFDDLVALVTRGIESRPDLDLGLSMMVIDEVQDCDPAQWALIDALSARGVATVVVGDERQSIYGFRGAVPELFGEHLDASAGTAVQLTRAFRHGPALTKAINALFDPSPDWNGVRSPNAEPGADREPPDGVALRVLVQEGGRTADERRRQNARLVVERIQSLVAQESMGGFADITILSPTRTGWSDMRAALRAAGIPFLTQSADLAWQTAGARGLAALLSFAATGDRIARVAALSSPWFGLSLSELLTDHASAQRLDMMRAQLDLRQPADVVVRDVVARSGALALVRQLATGADGTPPRPDLAEELMADLGFLLDEAAGYAAKTRRGIADFLNDVVRNRDEEARTRSASAGDNSDAVRLMTIHGAKGLEFRHVFLVGVDGRGLSRPEVLWPTGGGRLVGSLSDEFIAYGDLPADKNAVKQARATHRLRSLDRELYVAITRAKDTATVVIAHPTSTQAEPDEDGAEDTSAAHAWWLARVDDKGEPRAVTNIAEILRERLYAVSGQSAICPDRCADTTIAIETARPAGASPTSPQQAMAWASPLPPASISVIETRTGSRLSASEQAVGPQAVTPEVTDDEWQPDLEERAPGSLGLEIKAGAEFGDAVHQCVHILAMRATSVEDAEAAARALLPGIDPDGRLAVDDVVRAILRIYRSPLLHRDGVMHEYPVLARIEDPTTGETIIGGGILDVVRITEDGAEIIDFKTNAVDAASAPALAERYQFQLESYARALEASGIEVTSMQLLLTAVEGPEGSGLVVPVARVQ